TVESVSSIRREQACAFVDAHYATGNAVLVVSGNLTREQLDAALAKRRARVEPRTFAPARVVAPLDFAGKRVEQVADVDHDTVLVAWALPADPKQRARLTALAATVADLTAGEADASVSMIELGDSRFPVLGIVLSAPGVDAYAYLLS
ncbi:MAG TPA: insulinase family protein, partial [Kofleriaceae bacterium]|nr:insulinase family protein [Kofleriaceae bacterium]